MVKNLLKSLQCTLDDQELNTNEKLLLLKLILFHNYERGYAYPKYEDLMVSLSTNSRSKISKTIKSLKEKQYITVKKVMGNKSTYYINKYLFYGDNTNTLIKNSSKESIRKSKNSEYQVTKEGDNTSKEVKNININISI